MLGWAEGMGEVGHMTLIFLSKRARTEALFYALDLLPSYAWVSQRKSASEDRLHPGYALAC